MSDSAKSDVIVMRIAAEKKKLLEQAAAALGFTLTTFILNAALRASEETPAGVLQPGERSAVHDGVPTFFRGCIADARRGGEAGYFRAGFHLTIHLHDQMPRGMSEKRWDTEVEKLRGLLEEDDLAAAWGWFVLHFPRCMQLVPPRRKARFLEGVILAFQEGRV
jgi:hypothetical protein